MCKQTQGIDLAASLNTTERAISLAFRRMLKENTYWGAIHIRYGIDENWQHYREVLANNLLTETPTEEWEPFLKGVQEMFLSQLYSHGMGRHSSEEIMQIICADFQALLGFSVGK